MTFKDHTLPSGKWEFNAEVTEVFDEMLERSIPDYEGMRRTTTELAVRFAQPGSFITDLGCSRGAALKPIYWQLGDTFSYAGIEISPPMLAAAITELPFATITDTDLRHDYPDFDSSVVLSVLTLQFIPIEYRQKIVSQVYNSLRPGGIFLLVEKVLGRDSFTNELFIETYLERKGANGYSQEEINRKRESLEGVLVPVTSLWNEDLLKLAGFSHVECYWRHLNFAAWMGIKE
jgi:tRNA (cmo5U34)-methyltransferase